MNGKLIYFLMGLFLMQAVYAADMFFPWVNAHEEDDPAALSLDNVPNLNSEGMALENDVFEDEDAGKKGNARNANVLEVPLNPRSDLYTMVKSLCVMVPFSLCVNAGLIDVSRLSGKVVMGALGFSFFTGASTFYNELIKPNSLTDYVGAKGPKARALVNVSTFVCAGGLAIAAANQCFNKGVSQQEAIHLLLGAGGFVVTGGLVRGILNP